MARIEETILQNLFASEKFCRTVVPFLKPEYFSDSVEAVVAEEFCKFFSTHNVPATPEIISIELHNRKGLKDSELEKASEFLAGVTGEVSNFDWAVDKAEEFCKKRSVYNAILESITIMDGGSKDKTEDAIPQLLQDALGVSFDVAVGHDYLNDAEDRYDYYTAADEKIPFDLDELNKATKGGMKRKALYCVAAQSGGGKSIFLCHAAASALRQGKNVLYITMEMSEESISQRIDANLMNIPVDDLEKMTKDEFLTKIDKIRSKTNGCLKVKEFAAGAHSGHFRALIEELKTKQKFKPDLLVIDYLGICGSSRMRMGGSVNTNSFLRAVAEELRGLGKENNIPVLTGAQLNRGGYDNSDLSMSDIAESIGIAMTLDFFFALIATPELEEMDQVLVQILKNRYGAQSKFILGLTKKKMQFYNLEKSAQTSYVPKIPESAKKSAKTHDGTKHELPIFGSMKTVDASGFKF